MAFGGGKGGIGKSVICANIAVALGKRGWKVLLIDLDLGGANIHTLLNFGIFEKSISDFVEGKEKKLENLIFTLPSLSIDFIPGMLNSIPDATLRVTQRKKLIRHINKLNYDFIVVDLGAGVTPTVLDFFNMDQGVVIAVPQPTSIENVYRFVRSAFVRKLLFYKAGSSWKREVKSFFDRGKSFYKSDIDDFLDFVGKKYNDDFINVKKIIDEFNPFLILNMGTENDSSLIYEMELILKKMLGVNSKILGTLPLDEKIRDELRVKELTFITRPKSEFSLKIIEIADKISNKNERLL